MEAMERMRQSCVRVYEIQRPHRLCSKTLTVVEWRAGVSARQRAEGANEIVRETRAETTGRSEDVRM